MIFGNSECGPQRADTVTQRTTALAEANRIRSYRAQLKRDIKHGVASGKDCLATRSRDLDTMKVLDLLMAMPKVARKKANTILRRAGVSPSKTLGSLSERQRVALLAGLPR